MSVNKPHQPQALPFLFLTELWERFGFYVVQGLLVLYMSEYFGFSDTQSYTILGVFTALVYLSPLAGGLLASRVLGFQNAILWGGFFLIIGYALLALPYARTLLYPALATIIVGNGLFKPNISSLLGTQYAANDPRRDAGFTLFYIGINIGAFLAGMSSGYIKDYIGWRTSFGLASAGLIIGLGTFILGLKYIKANHSPFRLRPKVIYLLFIYALLSIAALSFLLHINTLADWLLPCIGLMLLVALTVLCMQQKPPYRKRMFTLSILIVSSIVFWMLFLQMFYAVNLFIERLVDKNFLGLQLSTTVFYASESVYIILLGPLFAWTWENLSRRKRNPSPLSKFTLGIAFAGLGFVILACSTFFPDSHGLIPAFWVFFAYLLITIGELLLSPIGLSAVSHLAPAHLAGLMMGVWFVATGFGGIFAGWLARLASVPENVTDNLQRLAIYQHAFLNFAYIAFLVAILLFFLQRLGRRLPFKTPGV